MTTVTVQETPHISQVLRDKRKETGDSKRSVYQRLGVSSGTYDMWEGGVYVPGDDYAELLADYLEIELPQVVWMLYRSRIQAKGVYVSSDSRTVIDLDALGRQPSSPKEYRDLVRSLEAHPAHLAKTA
jgi:transcriptional regulator with XRE-family HTH domain